MNDEVCMVVTMCVPGISLSLVLSLHNTRASSICIPSPHHHHHRHLCRAPIIVMQDGALQAPAINIASVSTVNTMACVDTDAGCCLVLCWQIFLLFVVSHSHFDSWQHLNSLLENSQHSTSFLSVNVAVMDTSNMDISIPFMLWIHVPISTSQWWCPPYSPCCRPSAPAIWWQLRTLFIAEFNWWLSARHRLLQPTQLLQGLDGAACQEDHARFARVLQFWYWCTFKHGLSTWNCHRKSLQLSSSNIVNTIVHHVKIG